VPKLSIFALGEDVLPPWLRLLSIGVPPNVLLPCDDPVVEWLIGVLPAGWRAVTGEGTLRGGDVWLNEGVDTPPAALLEADPGIGTGVAMFNDVDVESEMFVQAITMLGIMSCNFLIQLRSYHIPHVNV